jgi:hypothetical protein
VKFRIERCGDGYAVDGGAFRVEGFSTEEAAGRWIVSWYVGFQEGRYRAEATAQLAALMAANGRVS